MSSAPTADEIASDATWLAQALDPSQGMVRLVAMSRDSYRSAGFLDDRMLQGPHDAQIVSFEVVEEAVTDDLRADARWIFHIGHVGSTLVSRLLGELDNVLAVREPRILRDASSSPTEVRERYIAPLPRLMSRTFAETEIACVKATSFVSEIADALVPSGERALFMYAGPRNYISSILAGDQSLEEMKMWAQGRVRRMGGRVPPLEEQQRSLAHLAAAAWACEMTSLESAAERMPDRIIAWADFDRMLDDMPKALAGAADHFGFMANAAAIDAIVGGPLMQRYSKALEYDYSPKLRRELIAQEEGLHGRDIDDALAMLETAAEKSPLLVRALSRAREN
jgi:hypothetical protein